MRWFVFGGIAIGCGSPGLAPTSDVGSDPRVRALPAHVTLIAGLDGPALAAHPLVGDRLRAADAFGVPGGLWGVDHVVVGCGAHGCVGLADGSLDGATLRPDGRAGWGASERMRGPTGQIARLDRLGEGKVVFGDGPAVQDTRRRNRDQHGLLDGAWLDGLVPAGAIWVAATDAPRLHGQASAWVAGLGLTEATDVLLGLDEHARTADAHLDAVAIGVDLEREQLVVRARARTDGKAAWAARLARARLALIALPEGVRDARVAQEGALVELQLDLDPDRLAAHLAGGAP